MHIYFESWWGHISVSLHGSVPMPVLLGHISVSLQGSVPIPMSMPAILGHISVFL